MAANKKLLQLRHRIDAIDSDILTLLNARAQCAEEVAVVKKSEHQVASKSDTVQGEFAPVCFYRPEREAQILQRMTQESQGPLHDEQITKIYRDIISSCLALEECLKIAYLGPAGTFTQKATRKHFGEWVNTLPQESIAHVFQEVEIGRAHYGVIPIENSTGGIVSHTLDRFIKSPLNICGEIQLPIHQNLMSLNPEWESIIQVYSHEQSLIQCQHWLKKNLPHATLTAVASNAEAAKMASNDVTSAAVSSVESAEIYGLPIIQRRIEDLANNTTRFIVIAKQSNARSGYDKTSLLITAKNQSGALFELLKPLAKHGLDMSRIESRPSQSANWEYIFFLDIKGHVDDSNVRLALEELEQQADLLRVLGSYPTAIF